MNKYEIALVVTIEAENYDKALTDAHHLAMEVGYSNGVPCTAVCNYEHDHEGQRVLHLSNEDTP